MKKLIWIAMLAVALSSCGVKKDLKRPSEIQREEQQKQEKQQKKWESDGRV